MNRRDQELLDRQMRRFQPPPRRDGVIMGALSFDADSGADEWHDHNDDLRKMRVQPFPLSDTVIRRSRLKDGVGCLSISSNRSASQVIDRLKTTDDQVERVPTSGR
jgi:hypothetical protein